MLDTTMTGEVEDGLLAEDGGVEVARMDQEFVVFRLGFRDNLAVGINDQTTADEREAVLDTGLGDSHDPGGVLVSPGLHGEAIVEQPLLGPFLALLRIDRGRVVTE